MAPEVRKVKGARGLSAIFINWEDGAISVYSPDYDEWTIQGKDDGIYYAPKDSDHYKICMSVAGIEVRRN